MAVVVIALGSVEVQFNSIIRSILAHPGTVPRGLSGHALCLISGMGLCLLTNAERV